MQKLDISSNVCNVLPQLATQVVKHAATLFNLQCSQQFCVTSYKKMLPTLHDLYCGLKYSRFKFFSGRKRSFSIFKDFSFKTCAKNESLLAQSILGNGIMTKELLVPLSTKTGVSQYLSFTSLSCKGSRGLLFMMSLSAFS